VFCLATACLGAPQPRDQVPRVVRVEVGFDGKYKLGRWTPVRVAIAGGAVPVRADVTLTLLDGDGLPVTVRWEDRGTVEIPAGGQVSRTLYARFGRVEGPLTASLAWDGRPQDGEPSAAITTFPPAAVLASQELVLTVGPDAGVASALARQAERPALQRFGARIDGAADLPDSWLGYDGVDALVLTTSDPRRLAALHGNRGAALRRWVQLGGKLILCVGAEGQSLLGAQGLLEDLAPGRFVRVVAQRQTSGIETFAGAAQRLDLLRQDDESLGFKVPMSLLGDVRGRIEAYEGSGAARLPVIVRASWGLGQVVFVALDLDQFPLAAWQDRPRLVQRVLDLALGQHERTSGEHRLRQVSHAGYEDLAGQLRSALDQFPGVRLVPFSLIAIVAVLYIALIGPGDFLLWRRAGRRMEWTWLTFPLCVGVFCGWAWFWAQHWKGNQLRLNQVDLVDVDVATRLARGTTWAHLFSPRTQTFDLALSDAASGSVRAQPKAGLLTWQGLPGDGFGGMNRRERGARLAQPYTLVARDQGPQRPVCGLEGLPLQTWSSRSLSGLWLAELDTEDAGRLDAGADGLLHGSVRNPLPVELTDCMLYHDRWAYTLPNVGAGQRVDLGQLSPPRNIEWLLTRRKVVDTKDVSTPWDRDSRDVARILEVMMFHAASGGRTYTGLVARHQPDIDLSSHLQTGRAILVGRTRRPAVRLLRNGQPIEDQPDAAAVQQWTFYRLVLPVAGSDDQRARTARR